jgi:hypothetical protein
MLQKEFLLEPPGMMITQRLQHLRKEGKRDLKRFGFLILKSPIK